MTTNTKMEYKKPPPDPNLEKFMETSNYDNLAKYLIGNQYRFRENIIIPRLLGPVIIKTNEEKMIEATVESCPFKVVTSCVIGNLPHVTLFIRTLYLH